LCKRYESKKLWQAPYGLLKERTVKIREWIDKEARPLLSGLAVHMTPDQGTMANTVVAWKILDHIEKTASTKKAKPGSTAWHVQNAMAALRGRLDAA
jgi:hypothetical protein